MVLFMMLAIYLKCHDITLYVAEFMLIFEQFLIIKLGNLKVKGTDVTFRLHSIQCDQIGLNVDTLARCHKTLAIF